ncbi:acyl-CoA carboxylase subunit epsilon [Streptomyces albidus (ex Kaewkla and Franco 2022)]|uniref:acyl-CoA carboxylase subunit epsilon n=1 Tax=Streptomyces albidus (ex Kaewkla and Franco 2022) TaxID=722709 RepID=UPI0015EFA08C|nr:acyl-CoA carboxylase subunit epsilon [Streptomyces albidus (ex Kaewkla and Franco 2022)]
MLEPTTGENPPFPPIKVVRGNPTPEELAAALAVVRARAAAVASAGSESRPDQEWSDPARTVPRRVPHPGPKAWRTTYWPA